MLVAVPVKYILKNVISTQVLVTTNIFLKTKDICIMMRQGRVRRVLRKGAFLRRHPIVALATLKPFTPGISRGL
jgi:hypothetical protein